MSPADESPNVPVTTTIVPGRQRSERAIKLRPRMSQNAQRISMKPVQSLLCCGVAEFREQLQPRSSLSPKISRQTRYLASRESRLCVALSAEPCTPAMPSQGSLENLENRCRPLCSLAEDVSGTAPTWGIQDRRTTMPSSGCSLVGRHASYAFPGDVSSTRKLSGGSLPASDALLGSPEVQRRADQRVRCAWRYVVGS